MYVQPPPAYVCASSCGQDKNSFQALPHALTTRPPTPTAPLPLSLSMLHPPHCFLSLLPHLAPCSWPAWPAHPTQAKKKKNIAFAARQNTAACHTRLFAVSGMGLVAWFGAPYIWFPFLHGSLPLFLAFGWPLPFAGSFSKQTLVLLFKAWLSRILSHGRTAHACMQCAKHWVRSSPLTPPRTGGVAPSMALLPYYLSALPAVWQTLFYPSTDDAGRRFNTTHCLYALRRWFMDMHAGMSF